MVAVCKVVASPAVASPAVSAPICYVDCGAAEVEVIPARIAGVNGKVPVAARPVERAVEVSGGAECVPLPLQQDVAHVEVAPVPIVAEHVVYGRHSHEVVKVNLICSVILFGR